MPGYMDKIYCFNFPFKTNTANRLIENITKHMKILDTSKPYIVSTAHSNIDLRFIRHHKKVNKLKRTGLDVYLYEVLSTYIYDSQKNIKVQNRGYYSEHSYTIENHKSLYCIEFDQLDDLAKFLDIKINVYCCDYNVNVFFRKKYKNLNLFCYDTFLQTSYKNISNLKSKITHKFWCANRRYTPARHATMCYLADKNGRYSWHFDAEPFGQMLFPDPYSSVLEQGNLLLNSNSYNLDQLGNKVKVKNQAELYVSEVIDSSFGTLYRTLDNCFLAVVTETRFGQPTANISEKTLHPIHCNTPFVLVSPPKSLEYLHKLGFKTFNRWWSEDYDNELDHTKRLQKIFDIIDYINSMDIHKLTKMYEEMSDILSHNSQVVKHLSINPPKILR